MRSSTIDISAAALTFRKGDEVVLAEGPYRGTPGIFLVLTPDAKWAEIRERSGAIRHHPMVWLQHSAASFRQPIEKAIPK